jgi:membrane protease YdiL (CAAX protease family)
MKVARTLPVALGIYLVYNAIIFATWAAVGADYRDLASHDVILSRLVLPLTLGALFAGAAVTYLGWWRPVLFDQTKAKPRWALIIVLVAVVGFVLVNALAMRWSAFAPDHLLLLVVACILVGFNEELVVRGVLVKAMRDASSSEAKTLFWSCLLFGAMHIPNALFGIPLAAGLLQCVFAAIMGGALYVARRVSGTLLLPMIMHGAWDFSSLSAQVSKSSVALSPVFQFGTCLLALVAVVGLLKHARGRQERL